MKTSTLEKLSRICFPFISSAFCKNPTKSYNVPIYTYRQVLLYIKMNPAKYRGDLFTRGKKMDPNERKLPVALIISFDVGEMMSDR